MKAEFDDWTIGRFDDLKAKRASPAGRPFKCDGRSACDSANEQQHEAADDGRKSDMNPEESEMIVHVSSCDGEYEGWWYQRRADPSLYPASRNWVAGDSQI
jgi:hypothetical protein